MIKFDFADLNRKMEEIRRLKNDNVSELEKAINALYQENRRLPLECADALYESLKNEIAIEGAISCFDAYHLTPVLARMLVDHDDIGEVIHSFLTRHQQSEGRPVYERLWLAKACRFAASNAPAMPRAKRLELFYGFVDNIVLVLYSVVREEALNEEDIILLPEEMRFAYWIQSAFEALQQSDKEGFEARISEAYSCCPDLRQYLEMLKNQDNSGSPMTQLEREAYRETLAEGIKKAYEDENLMLAAERFKKFDAEGFSAGEDLRLLTIINRAHARGLLE